MGCARCAFILGITDADRHFVGAVGNGDFPVLVNQEAAVAAVSALKVIQRRKQRTSATITRAAVVARAAAVHTDAGEFAACISGVQFQPAIGQAVATVAVGQADVWCEAVNGGGIHLEVDFERVTAEGGAVINQREVGVVDGVAKRELGCIFRRVFHHNRDRPRQTIRVEHVYQHIFGGRPVEAVCADSCTANHAR